MSATTTQLLSSGEFCKLRFDTMPVKSACANVSFYNITQKCQILSCDTLVANGRYIYHQVPPTCFGVCYTIFRATTALLAHELYASYQCCHKVYKTPCSF